MPFGRVLGVFSNVSLLVGSCAGGHILDSVRDTGFFLPIAPCALQIFGITLIKCILASAFILQEKQQREIEQTRNDMMTVIQAIRSEKYADVEGTPSPQNNKELPEELAKMRADYEAKIAKLQEEHQQALRDTKRPRAVPVVTVEGEAEVKYKIKFV